MEEFIKMTLVGFLSSCLTQLLLFLKSEKQAKAAKKAAISAIEDGKPIKVYNGEKYIGDLIFVEHVEMSVKTPPAIEYEFPYSAGMHGTVKKGGEDNA